MQITQVLLAKYRLGQVRRDDGAAPLAQKLPDPALSLEAFQQAIMTGEVILDSGSVDPDLYVLRDQPARGCPRFTFARIREDATVTAFAVAILAEPLEGLPCFQIGYAVPKRFQKQGRAKAIVDAALAELQNDLADAIPEYFVAAVVSADSPISQAVASASISARPQVVIDQSSNVPAFQYMRKFGSQAPDLLSSG
ncbi:hypothetical protein [Mesorhizobium sp.]|uniref:hypothetical protein n=1 Tax=Mesorhizobium sp. TaxID=1871066 RepID=UPI00356B20C1